MPPARVEVDSERRYIAVNDSACQLLGYSREELLGMRIEDISAPSAAHVPAMYNWFVEHKEMSGIFALRKKNGEIIRILYESKISDGRQIALWTHFEPVDTGSESDL